MPMYAVLSRTNTMPTRTASATTTVATSAHVRNGNDTQTRATASGTAENTMLSAVERTRDRRGRRTTSYTLARRCGVAGTVMSPMRVS